MKKALWIILAIIILLVLVAGYFGLFPGLSDVMGANKAKDLGVKYTEQDLQTGREMTGVILEDSTAEDKSLAFSGEKDISGVYTNAVMTAMINSAKYKYYPLSNAQIRVNPDGTVESSGNFNIEKAIKWSEDLGGSADLSNKALSYTKYVSSNPSFYLKGQISMTDNQFDLNITQARISRFNAPASVIEQYQGDLANFVEQRMSNVPGLNVKSAVFSNGALKLDATYPAVEKSGK